MIDPKDNPPAFPKPVTPHNELHYCEEQEGMTLLDYFAAKAMHSISVRIPLGEVEGRDGCVKRTEQEMLEVQKGIAWGAYDLAESMLVERKRRMDGGK